jgi:hypothetical protein
MTTPTSSQCPICGAPVQKNTTVCLACGSPLISIGRENEDLAQSARQVVEDLNTYLVKSAVSAAELAFSVGCTLGALVILVLLVVVYFASTKTWTIVIVTGLIALLAGVIVASMLALRAKNATIEKTYQQVTKPEIERFIKANGMSEQEFTNLAASVLPQSAPLRDFWNQERKLEGSEI